MNSSQGSPHSLPPQSPVISISNSPNDISLNRTSFSASRSPTTSRFPTGLDSSTTSAAGSPYHLYSSSTTHAGGIQPSASFFRPSKPSQLTSRSASPAPSSSLISIHDVTGEGSEAGHNTDIINMSSLIKKPSLSSLIDHTQGPRKQSEDHPGKRGVAAAAASRDNLPTILTTSPTRPSFQHQRNLSSSGPSGNATGRRVRTSLDAIFNLRRGLSTPNSGTSSSAPRVQHYSPRKSFATTGTYTDEDEERFVGGSGYPSQKYMPSPSPSPTPSHVYSQATTSYYTATKPPAYPPLCAVPIPDPKSKSSSKPMLNYRFHPSRNRFFLNGRIMTGGDSPLAFIGSFFVVLGIAGAWFGTTCVWWWKDLGSDGGKVVSIVGAYSCLIVISTMLFTAFTDPGILPRNLDPDPPYPTSTPSDGGVKAPLPRDLKVRSDVVRVKYCPTCKTYRPPRSSHCKMCDNCVDDCDHHCQWVNNCIGRRNYGTFVALLFAAVITLALVISTSAVHLAIESHRRGSFKSAIGSSLGIGSAVAFALSICVTVPVFTLWAYHARLLLINVTTIEQIRNQAHKKLDPEGATPNPFSHGNWRRNLIAVLGRPRGYSWLDARGIATEDRREVNPGLMQGQQLRSDTGR